MKRGRILVVDDHRSAADMLSLFFELEGFEVRTAYDGMEAVATAREFAPTIIMLDLTMPHLNGLEAAKQIREQHLAPGAVLVALTAHEQEEDKRRVREAGFQHHLVKPVDPLELREFVTTLANAG